MGVFLHVLLFPGGEQAACEAAVRQAAASPERNLQPDQCRWRKFPRGSAALLNDSCSGYEDLADGLSRILPGPSMVLYIYDDDYWGYFLYQNGAELDQFASLPDYFGAGSPPNRPGNAGVLAGIFGVPEDVVHPYVLPWTDEKMGLCAREGDQAVIGDSWQLADFMDALGFPFDQLCPPEPEAPPASETAAPEAQDAPVQSSPGHRYITPIDTPELPNALTSRAYALARTEEVRDLVPEAAEKIRSMACESTIPLLTAAIQRHPERAALYVLRAFCWNQLDGRFSGMSRKPDMDRDMTRLLELEPNNVLALRARCPTTGTSSRYLRHIQDLTRLMELDPEHQDLYQVSRAYRRHWLGDDQSARADLQAVLERGELWTVDLVYLCRELSLPGF